MIVTLLEVRHQHFYKISGFIDQKDRIDTSKLMSIQHYYGNHGDGAQPSKDIEVLKKHGVNDHLLILVLSMFLMLKLELDILVIREQSIFIQI